MLHRVIRKLIPPGLDYQSIVFFLLDMQRHTGALPRSARPISYHAIVSIHDECWYALCDTYPTKQFHLRMIHDCQHCYVAIINSELVGYAWVTTSPCYVSEINFTLPVGEDNVYIYDCFVANAFRGQGIYSALLTKIVADYRGRHWPDRYGTAYIGAEPGNKVSIRGIKRVGFEEFTQARYVHVGQLSRWYGVNRLIERMGSGRPASNPLSD